MKTVDRECGPNTVIKEEVIAQNPLSGVIRFKKRISMGLDGGARNEGLQKHIGRVLAERRGTYCRDLGGWLVGYKGVKTATEDFTSPYCWILAEWFVFRPITKQLLEVIFHKRVGSVATCMAEVESQQHQVDVVGIEEETLDELQPRQRLIVRLERVGYMSSSGGDKLHMMGSLKELSSPEGGFIQLVDQESILITSDDDDDCDTRSQDSGLYSNGRRSVRDDDDVKPQIKRKLSDDESSPLQAKKPRQTLPDSPSLKQNKSDIKSTMEDSGKTSESDDDDNTDPQISKIVNKDPKASPVKGIDVTDQEPKPKSDEKNSEVVSSKDSVKVADDPLETETIDTGDNAKKDDLKTTDSSDKSKAAEFIPLKCFVKKTKKLDGHTRTYFSHECDDSSYDEVEAIRSWMEAHPDHTVIPKTDILDCFVKLSGKGGFRHNCDKRQFKTKPDIQAWLAANPNHKNEDHEDSSDEESDAKQSPNKKKKLLKKEETSEPEKSLIPTPKFRELPNEIPLTPITEEKTATQDEAQSIPEIQTDSKKPAPIPSCFSKTRKGPKRKGMQNYAHKCGGEEIFQGPAAIRDWLKLNPDHLRSLSPKKTNSSREKSPDLFDSPSKNYDSDALSHVSATQVEIPPLTRKSKQTPAKSNAKISSNKNVVAVKETSKQEDTTAAKSPTKDNTIVDSLHVDDKEAAAKLKPKNLKQDSSQQKTKEASLTRRVSVDISKASISTPNENVASKAAKEENTQLKISVQNKTPAALTTADQGKNGSQSVKASEHVNKNDGDQESSSSGTESSSSEDEENEKTGLEVGNGTAAEKVKNVKPTTKENAGKTIAKTTKVSESKKSSSESSSSDSESSDSDDENTKTAATVAKPATTANNPASKEAGKRNTSTKEVQQPAAISKKPLPTPQSKSSSSASESSSSDDTDNETATAKPATENANTKNDPVKVSNVKTKDTKITAVSKATAANNTSVAQESSSESDSSSSESEDETPKEALLQKKSTEPVASKDSSNKLVGQKSSKVSNNSQNVPKLKTQPSTSAAAAVTNTNKDSSSESSSDESGIDATTAKKPKLASDTSQTKSKSSHHKASQQSATSANKNSNTKNQPSQNIKSINNKKNNSPHLSSTINPTNVKERLKIQESDCSPILPPVKNKVLNTTPITGIIKNYFEQIFEKDDSQEKKKKTKKKTKAEAGFM